MPREIMTVTGFATVANTLYGLTMVNMGTMVKIDDMISQWKTLLIGFASVCAICFLVVFAGPLVIDRRFAVCGAPVVAGGMPVYLMVKEIAEANDFVEGGIFGLLVLLTQSLVGLPISSIILRKLCKDLLDQPELLNGPAQDFDFKKKESKPIFRPMPQELCKPVVFLAKGALLTSLATFLSSLTGGAIHYMIFCLLLGIIFGQLGFIEKEYFQKANGFGLMMFMVLAMCFGSLPVSLRRCCYPCSSVVCGVRPGTGSHCDHHLCAEQGAQNALSHGLCHWPYCPLRLPRNLRYLQ